MEIQKWYKANFEALINGRYITTEKISPVLEGYKNVWEISEIGHSEKSRHIHLVRIGSGEKVVLAWSQMHGNESTTTKALFDLLKFLSQDNYFQKEIQQFLESYSFYFIPILNPDGASAYTRENGNGIDLNRDAQNQSQRESRILRTVFDKLKPDGCLNMHDQRSIYGLDNGKSAAISFLSPAANPELSITPARKKAMEGIVRMNGFLQKIIPGQVGRYDDSFNSACVGDTFQMAGVPTILFEAGHIGTDYQREESRELVFYSLLAFFGIIGNSKEVNYREYFSIPENRKNYRDIIIRGCDLPSYNSPMDVAIQYEEILRDGKIELDAHVEAIGDLALYFGHVDSIAKIKELLTNDLKNLTVGVKIDNFCRK